MVNLGAEVKYFSFSFVAHASFSIPWAFLISLQSTVPLKLKLPNDLSSLYCLLKFLIIFLLILLMHSKRLRVLSLQRFLQALLHTHVLWSCPPVLPHRGLCLRTGRAVPAATACVLVPRNSPLRHQARLSLN